MDELARMRARIERIEELGEIIQAMRSLAGAAVQEAQDSLAGIRAYAGVIDAAIAEAVSLLPADGATDGRGDGPPVTLAFCAEHGFVGGFNERILDRVEEEAAGGALWIAGARGATLAAERGLAVDWSCAMATHAGGVPETGRRIAAHVYRRFGSGGATRLEAVFARYRAGGQFELARRAVLPLDLSRFPVGPGTSPPLHQIPADRLLLRLTDEYIVAEMTHAAMESFASENGARLRTMAAARDNVERRLEELGMQERRLRQEAVTTELLDVITGAEAQLHGRQPRR